MDSGPLWVDVDDDGEPTWCPDAPGHEHHVIKPATRPCSCRPSVQINHWWHGTIVRRTSSRVRINPTCTHHGKTPR
jgi:hypothetical protein